MISDQENKPNQCSLRLRLGYRSFTSAILVHDLYSQCLLFDSCVSFSPRMCVFVCSRACRSSGPVSFKPPTSANQSRNRILRPSSTSSSSTTPPVGNRNTSVFPRQVRFFFFCSTDNEKWNVATANTHSPVLILYLLQIKTHSRWVLPFITSALMAQHWTHLSISDRDSV